ncbi:MAG: beta-propeller domain-containing protein [Polyangiaceae bacterium]
MFLKHPRLLISLASLAALQLGCESDKDSTINDGSTIFESDRPQGSASGRGAMAADDATSGNATPSQSDGASESAERAIEEADIVKFEGNRLYALSQYGGLNVIDTSDRDHLRVLGRKKVQASPFEMYVKDSIVFALYNGYGEYVRGATDGAWNYAVTSYVIAFDTTNPAKTEIIGKFAVPGTISDSRIVGDVLYVVGFEENSCWGCQQGQHTTVISLDVSDPSSIRKVDQLSYADDTSSYSWRRSISVNDQRMYIAGPEYGNNGPIGSTIQVVDISDPKGDLVEGTTVKASGVVSSRWQMDEYAGHLRVITQPGSWSLTEPVRIQTYQVASAREVTPLADVAMNIPLRETLRSVRFDGLRGYAITAEQKDPLFTIDLSDPAAPKQAGQLEIPGWIYHMEPRGERVVALGYDQGNPNGALAISLFDVSKLAEPTLLDRVKFRRRLGVDQRGAGSGSQGVSSSRRRKARPHAV